VELLKTFADQAVIAIENVRLFNETKEALEQQTATSEILRVISSSPTDIQPVLDAVAQNAARVCGADDALIYRVDGDVDQRVAHHGPIAETAAFERRLSRDSVSGRATVDRRTIHVPDIEAAPGDELPETRRLARLVGARTHLAAPLIREGAAIGAILIRCLEVRPFAPKQISLLETFADQAVIAIENVRLFTELQASNRELTESLEQQTATSEILGVIPSSPTDAQPVFDAIVAAGRRLLGGFSCAVRLLKGDGLHLAAFTTTAPTGDLDLTSASISVRHAPLMAQVIADRTAVVVPDTAMDPRARRELAEFGRIRGYRSLLIVPLLREGHVIGVINVTRQAPGPFSPSEIALLETFAAQAVIAIENVRLFTEIEDKSRQLEVASQHKSEFLANMSHELRTPMNAILGFSEVLAEGMFGEINDKQAEYLRDILESGRHLLSLINDILDLSKIEAGRMELEPTDFDLPGAIDNALTLVRERASRRGIMLGRAIDERVGMIRADERKVKQVLLNLLSNALKFTPEGGRIDVRATLSDGRVEVSVADTGVGIAPEDQEAVFEEFRQVGTADKKVEGTGLGLALSRKFIELHGGRIWVKSQLGQGSTFTFTLPVRRGG
jgi:signal transduction histidine kinase